MSINNERGFTIIEVILFLAISGALFAALMIGVNTGITQQRYSDSVRSYKSLLEGQYAAAINTANEAVGVYKCQQDINGRQLVSLDSSRDPRGTSKCVVLGRAIQVVNGGRQVAISSITGYDPTGTDLNNNGVDDSVDVENSNDEGAIKLYKPALSMFDKKVVDLDWQSYLKTANSGATNTLSSAVILIIMSPVTGALKTYFSSTSLTSATTADLRGLITPPASSLKNCIFGESGLLPKQIITIDPNIAGANSVSVADDSSGVCR